MKNTFELTDFIKTETVDSAKKELVDRFVARRKEMGVSQKALASTSGVSYASIRRFECKGEISLSALMSLAKSLDMLDDFGRLFTDSKIKDLKDI